MTLWKPILVLPNLRLKGAVGGELVAIAGAEDSRIAEIEASHKRFGSFLNRFSDAFGVRSRPSVLLVRSDAPKSCFDIGALASFRDIVSVTTVARGRSLQQVYRSPNSISWANTFDFHPWMIDKNYEYLVANTPALLALHEVNKFNGQCSPELSRHDLNESELDRPVLDDLIQRWHAHYPLAGTDWKNLALFRSLSMANQACLLPSATAATVYDFGRAIGSWISAFEILVHPGGATGRADFQKVVALLEATPWVSRFPRRFDIGNKNKGSIASWLYRQMYHARNAFLHGNPVSLSDLLLAPGGRGMLNFCAPLFRAALTSFLDIRWSEKSPSTSDTDIIADYINRHSTFMLHQHLPERALQACRSKREKDH
jgi:hypothetical protein